jgi:hypothetical protein
MDGNESEKQRLLTSINKIIPELMDKGWHVIHNDFYIAVSGYSKNKKTKALEPRNEHIVSVGICNIVNHDGSINADVFEIKTYWQGVRNVYADFAEAWNIFIIEIEKYDPNQILWSKLDNQQLQIDCSMKKL